MALALACLFLASSSARAATPTVTDDFVSAVTTKSAVLHAAVNPEGGATAYHFEYGTANCASNPCTSVPIPDAGIGAGTSTVSVAKEISGLQPSTTYHYRVVATNASGTTMGPSSTFNTYAPPESPSCPNDNFRIGASAVLPDCRAYEMVSPVNKNGGDIKTPSNILGFRTALNKSSINGEKFTYSSYKAFADAVSAPYSSQYIATRGDAGWTTHAISPPHASTIFQEYDITWDLEVQFKAITDDLSTAWLSDDAKPPLTADALAGWVNLYERNNLTDAYTAITTEPPSFGSLPPGLGAMEVEGHSRDGNHLVFSVAAALTPDAGQHSHQQIYDFTEGELHLVSVLPNETANPSPANVGWQSETLLRNGRYGTHYHAVSDDGSRIFWTATENGNTSEGGKIYVRIDGKETRPVSEAVSPSRAAFWAASADGAKAIFTIGESLYVTDVDAEAPTLIAGQSPGIVGASDDASHIYFVSTEGLDGASAGGRNLYLWREGAIEFIAELDAVDLEEGFGPTEVSGYTVLARVPVKRASRVTPDGKGLAFQSIRSLTGYDNTDAVTGERDLEVFVYDAETGELICASCNPSGARPTGQALQLPFRVGDQPATANAVGQRGTAAWLTTSENSLHTPRALADDGNRIFFNSFDALVPEDINGKQDVYQWEAMGKGTCQRTDGCLSLVSSGVSPAPSEFVDASPDGSDVFFSTGASLLPQDPDRIDIYNARVQGGFPPPPPPPPPCFGDACQAVSEAPQDAPLASASYKGEGDPSPAASEKCKRHADRAAKLRRRVSILRRRAEAVGVPRKAAALNEHAARLAGRAKALRSKAAACRRNNRRLGL
jgi:WD40-like Beta Propeller Repeat